MSKKIEKTGICVGVLFILVLVLGTAPVMGKDACVPSPDARAEINGLAYAGILDTPDDAREVAVVGNYAYIADKVSLRIVDVSDPTKPVELSSILSDAYQGGCYAVAVAGNYAYCAGYAKLYIVDVSDPTKPVQAGTGTAYGLPMGLAAAGNYVYFLENQDTGSGYLYRMFIYDVSNPASPSMKGLFTFNEIAVDVAVAGDYAFIANEGVGLRVLNISDSTKPVAVGSYDPAAYIMSVAVEGSYAYVGVCSGLRIVNISNPAAPVDVGGISTSTCALDVAVASGYAFAAESGAARMFDVSNPAFPGSAGSYHITGYTHGGMDMAVADGYVYVASGDVGLVVLRISLSKIFLPLVIR